MNTRPMRLIAALVIAVASLPRPTPAATSQPSTIVWEMDTWTMVSPSEIHVSSWLRLHTHPVAPEPVTAHFPFDGVKVESVTCGTDTIPFTNTGARDIRFDLTSHWPRLSGDEHNISQFSRGGDPVTIVWDIPVARLSPAKRGGFKIPTDGLFPTDMFKLVFAVTDGCGYRFADAREKAMLLCDVSPIPPATQNGGTCEVPLARTTAAHSSAATSPSVSLSELLEEGIYTEETKGDIAAAISIYRQLVTEGAANAALAAQAQFRLAQCYLKTNRKDEATAEFQKLVTNFPTEKELISKANTFLAAGPQLNPAPWLDGERLQLKLFYPNGTEGGIMEYRSNLVQSGTQSIWRVGGFLSVATVTAVSTVDTDAETFHPVSSRWKHSLMGEVHALYHPGEVELSRDGKTESTPVKVEDPVIDNEEAMDYIRRLPLKEGYKTTLPIFSSLGGAPVTVTLEVQGREMADSPVGKFDCYKVQLSVGQTFWFSTDAHRYLVKCAVGPLTGKLTAIEQRKLDEPVTFNDPELGVSITAPPYWVICRYKTSQPAGQSLIRAYDANADAEDGGVRFFATDKLSPEEQKSSKAWAGSELKTYIMKLSNDVKVRPDSWKDYTVSGRPGVSFIADYTENGIAKTLFSLYVIGPKDSEHFVIIAPPGKFDALKKQFDGIIASYQRK